MKEIKDTTYKGTRILLGNDKRDLINKMVDMLKTQGFQEISIPVIQYKAFFTEGVVGKENLNLMFNFQDRAERSLCLAPEYTAIMIHLAKTAFFGEKDVKLFYVQECFRGEKPQAGRYRQFTQLGVEILNPTRDYNSYLSTLATELITPHIDLKDFELNLEAIRGLGYYKGGKGFEISLSSLGAQKQVVGGGEYEGGVGFAIGIDRLMLLK